MAIIYNGVNVAQDPLVSGTNIKTVNGTSLLGSGDITAGASTDYLAIGTCVLASEMNMTANAVLPIGDTVAGSALYRYSNGYANVMLSGVYISLVSGFAIDSTRKTSIGASGTWRRLSYTSNAANMYSTGYIALYMRVS